MSVEVGFQSVVLKTTAKRPSGETITVMRVHSYKTTARCPFSTSTLPPPRGLEEAFPDETTQYAQYSRTSVATRVRSTRPKHSRVAKRNAEGARRSESFENIELVVPFFKIVSNANVYFPVCTGL